MTQLHAIFNPAASALSTLPRILGPRRDTVSRLRIAGLKDVVVTRMRLESRRRPNHGSSTGPLEDHGDAKTGVEGVAEMASTLNLFPHEQAQLAEWVQRRSEIQAQDYIEQTSGLLEQFATEFSLEALEGLENCSAGLLLAAVMLHDASVDVLMTGLEADEPPVTHAA